MSDSTTRKCFEKLLAQSVERAQAELDRDEIDFETETEIATLIRIEQADRQIRFAQRVALLDASIRDAQLQRMKAAVDVVLAILLPCTTVALLTFGVAAGSGAARASFFATAVVLAALARGKKVSRRETG